MGGYINLRDKRLRLQREHAEEIECLKTKNKELAERSEELARAARQGISEIQHSSSAEVSGLLEFRRRAEIVERQSSSALCHQVEATREASSAQVEKLVCELKSLRGKCGAHRRRRVLELDGARTDLSLLSKKLGVLSAVADEANIR